MSRRNPTRCGRNANRVADTRGPARQVPRQLTLSARPRGPHQGRGCKTDVMPRPSEPSPYVEFDRRQWRALRMSTPQPLTEEEVVGLRGLGEQINLLEVEEVYLPLARLLHLQVTARQGLFSATSEFLGEPQQNPDPPGPAGITPRASIWSPPTASSIRTPSWLVEISCTARVSRRAMTGGR